MFDELMLPREAELRTREGSSQAEIALRLPWYRSLPISCVDGIDISIDGTAIEQEAVTVSVGDTEHTVASVGDLAEVEWFVLDRAVARFPVPEGFPAGPHEVALTLTLRIPYAEPEYWPIEFNQTATHSRLVNFLGEDS